MQLPIETRFRSFIQRLQTLADDHAAASAYAESYLAWHSGNFPIIEGDTVHFVCKQQPGTMIGIGGDWNGFDPQRAFMKPIGGGLLHYQHSGFEPDARLDYLFYEFAASTDDCRPNRHANPLAIRPDPLNLRFGESGFGPRSELAMPAYQRPASTIRQSGIESGTVHRQVITSKALQQERPYSIYVPVQYDTGKGAYPSIYFHDGGDYLTMGKAPIVLDNLIGAGIIPPVVAVFVPPLDREREYNCDERYVRFLCDELVPEMQRRYHLKDDPVMRATIGPSLGGLIALYVGNQRPGVFGLVGAQSSAVRSINGLDIFDARKAYTVVPRLPLRLDLVMGSYEDCFAVDKHGRCRDLLNPVRELHSLLEQHGYPHRYAEQHQGHSWGLWRDCLGDMLTYFFAF